MGLDFGEFRGKVSKSFENGISEFRQRGVIDAILNEKEVVKNNSIQRDENTR